MESVLAALALCLEPQNLFVNVLCGFPTGLIYLWFVQAICPPRSNRLYWGVGAGYLFLLVMAKPLLPAFLRMIGGVLTGFLLPVLTTRGSVAFRSLVCLLCMLLQFATELVAVLIWVSLTGLGSMDNTVALQHVGAFLLAMVSGHFILLPLLLTGLKRLCDRFFVKQEQAARGDGPETSRWMRRFALVPFLQLAFLYVVIVITFDVMRSPMNYVLVATALLALCIAVDIVLLVEMRRAMQKREADLQAALLEERVAAYLQELADVQDLLAATAKMRHDLRNHVAVVQLMAERGEYAEARKYLAEARKGVE